MYLKTVQGAKHDPDGPPCTPTDYLQNGRYNVRTFMFKINKKLFLILNFFSRNMY